MASRGLSSLPPTKENLHRLRVQVRVTSGLFRLGMRHWAPLRVTGADQLQPRDPYLFLANHTGLFDPPSLVIAARRHINMLATESNIRSSAIGRFITAYGGVPKKKYTSDVRAIMQLRRWADLGASIGVFPEGQRSWDGKPLPLVPGIEKLVALLKLPVVTCRIRNAYRQSPRWAERMRRGTVLVELDPPQTFDTETPDQISEHIRKAIAVDPMEEPRFPLTGRDLAAGISNVAWACPVCGEIRSFIEEGNRVRCSSCRSRWRVDWDCRLVSLDGARSHTLPEVVALAEQHQLAGDRFGRTTILESEPMKLWDITKPRPRLVGDGVLRLLPDELVVDGPLPWSAPLDTVAAPTVDMRRRLTLRVGTSYMELEMARESVLKWVWFTEQLLARRSDAAASGAGPPQAGPTIDAQAP